MDKLTLEDFRNKAIQRKQDLKMIMEIEVDGYGAVTFNKPTTEQLLTFVGRGSDAVKTDKEGNTISQDMNELLDAAKDLVFASCSFLKDPELQKEFGVIDPPDIAVEVFGITETMSIASEVAENFMNEKTIKDVETEIKN